MKHLAVSVSLSVLVTACGLFSYDRFVVRPAQVIGVVDVAEVYRMKEAEFASLITAGITGEERNAAIERASEFARRLPVALDELPGDCRCLVVLKSAVAGRAANTRDLTALLKMKLEQR